jgi:superoxide dismutase, Cu-Zn family
MKRIRMGAVLGVAAMIGVGCGDDRPEPEIGEVGTGVETGAAEAVQLPSEPGASASAVLLNRQGQEVGEATLRQEGEVVVIEVNARNVPGGDRAIHIHENGSCEPPTFDSAGDHFNPTGRAHGFDHPDGPHAGDLRNLVVDPDDNIAHETYRNDRVTLRRGQPNSLLDGSGTALVIHEGADDYVTQPSGDAGDPLICGVITPA